jgi:hypothetical protein
LLRLPIGPLGHLVTNMPIQPIPLDWITLDVSGARLAATSSLIVAKA